MASISTCKYHYRSTGLRSKCMARQEESRHQIANNNNNNNNEKLLLVVAVALASYQWISRRRGSQCSSGYQSQINVSSTSIPFLEDW